jgi:hypothetical protein
MRAISNFRFRNQFQGMNLKSAYTFTLSVLCVLICPFFFLGCGTSSTFGQNTRAYPAGGSEPRGNTHSVPLEKVAVNLVLAPIKPISTKASDFALPRKPLHLKPEYPVARQIVENYYKSGDKTPGGHCLAVSKDRFEEAYKDVYGHAVYQDLPDTIATEQLTPREVFHNLFVTATKTDPKWRNLPLKYRAKGNAGALAIADLGEMVDTEGIWNGKLRPGALVQVWRLKEDYERVRKGAKMSDFDPYGHSFIFLGYELDEKGVIQGLRIADQGYQSYRSLVSRDYEVWWGVNLKV